MHDVEDMHWFSASDAPLTCGDAQQKLLCGHAGGLPYNDVPSDHDGYHLSFFDVRDALPEKRVLHLKGGCSSPTSIR